MRSTVALWALLLALVAGGATAGLLSPLSGDGAFHFDVDAPVFQDGEGARVDLCAQIRHHELRFRNGSDGRMIAELEAELKIARQGSVAVSKTQRFVVYAEDQEAAVRRDRFALLDLPIRVPAGRWAVTLRLRDVVRGTESAIGTDFVSTAQGVLEVPVAGTVAMLSDPEFRIGQAGHFVAHPERVYGIAQDTLEVYLEMFRPRSGLDYVVDVEVYDPVYGGMDGESLVLRPAGELSAARYRLPLASFPEGSYRLRLTPQWAPDAQAEYEFGVQWRLDAALGLGADVEVEGRLLFDGREYDQFCELSSSGQQAMLARFWEELDPTPDTEANELRDVFTARVAFADRQFGSYGLHGALTDRGRIYIRYGGPRDVSVEVIPINGTDLDDTIGKVHDAFRMDRHGTAIKVETTESVAHKDLGLADSKRNRRRAGQEGSFELWTYTLDGNPLFSWDRHFSENVDLRFLFVDRKGIGFYALEYSNLPTQD